MKHYTDEDSMVFYPESTYSVPVLPEPLHITVKRMRARPGKTLPTPTAEDFLRLKDSLETKHMYRRLAMAFCGVKSPDMSERMFLLRVRQGTGRVCAKCFRAWMKRRLDVMEVE